MKPMIYVYQPAGAETVLTEVGYGLADDDRIRGRLEQKGAKLLHVTSFCYLPANLAAEVELCRQKGESILESRRQADQDLEAEVF